MPIVATQNRQVGSNPRRAIELRSREHPKRGRFAMTFERTLHFAIGWLQIS